MAVVSNDNGMSRRLPGIGFKADAAEILDVPIGACTTFLSVSRVGRDRPNAQKCKQSFVRSVQIRFNVGEDGFEIRHASLQEAILALSNRSSCIQSAQKGLRRK